MPRRTDTNQPEIVEALRAAGATVQHLHMVGQGCPDLLVGRQGYTFLIEVKDGDKPPSKRKLTDREKIWHFWWDGVPVDVVENVADALKVIGAI
jgi:hypothetical protein